MIQHTLLDVLFVCLVSSRRQDIFRYDRKIYQVTLFYRPKINILASLVKPCSNDGRCL